MPSTLDLVFIAGSIAAAMGWIEHGHSVVIDSPDIIELASRAPDLPCSQNAGVRYGLSEIIFLGDGFMGGPDQQDLPAAVSSCDTK
jgi:hypothetical protein